MLALTAAGCASSGVTLPESQFLRLLEGKAGLIAYLGMDGNLYTIDQTGGNKYQVTDDVPRGLAQDLVYLFRRFAWSPEGDRLAYIGFTDTEWTVNISKADGSETTQIYTDDTETPADLLWTPNGAHLSLLTDFDYIQTEGVRRQGLRIIPENGSASSALLLEGFPLHYSWEPEGDRALVHVGGSAADDPNARISLVTIGSDFERNLELPPAVFNTPAWSPDGLSLLLAITDAQGRDALVLANLQGQTRATLTTFNGAVTFTWSPDNRFIGYITSESIRQGANGPLRIVEIETGETVFESEEPLVNAFFWSPDSRQLVYFTHELATDESQENLFSGMGLHFLDTEKWEARHPQLGGNPFFFQPSPLFRLYLMSFDRYQQGATIWSPDGEYIVLPMWAGTESVIMVVAVSGNREPRPIDTGMMAFWSGQK